MKQTISALATVVLLAACGGASTPEAPAPPPPLDPTGSYAITIDAMGQTLSGTLLVSGTADAYSGSIDTEMGGAAISDIIVDGDVMMFSVSEVGLDFTLTFDGDSFVGEFGGDMGAGTIVGTKEGG